VHLAAVARMAASRQFVADLPRNNNTGPIIIIEASLIDYSQNLFRLIVENTLVSYPI
jgi:hypothetical protein